MTVQELIDELSKYDPDMEVVVEGDQDYIDHLFPVMRTMKIDRRHSKYTTDEHRNMPFEFVMIV